MITKLYDQFQPDSYKLQLVIDPEKLHFKGTVTILGAVTEPTHTVSLHAKDLTITTASINDKSVQFSEAQYDTLVLKSDQSFTKDQPVTVVVEFEAEITDAMHGIYPCYFEHNGTRKKLIATQFESHHAREVFPCIDEPAAKATFDLELTTPLGETVLGNMPIKSTHDDAGKTVTLFETTPKMSTYLLAFVCGEMVVKESKTKDGVIVRSWASTAQDASWLDFSVQEAINYIEFYNDYFGIPYPLEKCDQVALPDFESGAMENWGLITYRETVLLSDPKNPSLSTQQLIAIVVAHELSHQWFGNLVTMNWWDDLWLNESFASMMEYIAVDNIHPEWMMWEEYIGNDCIHATNRDVYSDVQPVRVTVTDPAEIHTLFDPSIVYAKGGKLLKSLCDLIGEKSWRDGLSLYFKTHAYGNTSRDDLWAAFSVHSDHAIHEIMSQWIEHAGLPLVTVKQIDQKVSVSQQRLLLDGESDMTLWQIPLLAHSAPELLTEKELVFDATDGSWVQLNSSGVGHYVVNYLSADHKTWLASQITNTAQPSSWKISRLNELVMLARHGDTQITEALNAIKTSGNESRAAVWSQIAGIIGNARQLTEGDDQVDQKIKAFIYQLTEANYKQLGWNYQITDDSNTTHLRTTMLGLAVGSEEPAVIESALDLYKSYDSKEELPAEIRHILMGVAVRFGTEDDFSYLIEQYKNSTIADYKSDICIALTSTKNPDQAKQLLQMMLDTDIVRTQDTIRWFIHLMRNRYNRDQAWSWLVDNWPWILENFKNSKSYDDFARYSASFMNTNEWLEAYSSFFKDKKQDPALKRTISIAEEEIKARTKWRTRDESATAQWFKNL